jgi:hypothetical protein
MQKYQAHLAFALIAIGTSGLLLNDFILEWGRLATLVFAASNVLGLVLLKRSLTKQSDAS